MTVDKLQRVIWRLREKQRNNPQKLTKNDLKRATIMEIGHDPRTLKLTRTTLITLKWIKSIGAHYIELTNKDLT